jgi:sugar/nucleoside kinase (ribokinase family)
MGDLLIAGPTALDDHPRQNGLLGGVGLYAAIAAAPLARTQLWSRAGNGINNQLKAIITRHGIDLAGVSWDGPTPHGGPNGFEPGGPLLPDIEPTDAASLGAVLLIGLPPDEWRRAQRVALALPGAAERPLVASPRPGDLADPGFRAEVCRCCQLLVLSVAQACRITATSDPLSAAQALQKDGARAVALTASALGGLLVYGQKTTTWPTWPVPVVDKAGVSAAFPGAVAGWLAGPGRADWTNLKRACAIASGVGAICAQGIGPKKLFDSTRADYLERFNRIRRDNKF